MSRKHFHFNITLALFLMLCDFVRSLFDPLSIGLIAGGVSLLYKREIVKEYTYCLKYECCIDSHIPALIGACNNLFGQHIVRSQTISALRSFYKHLDKSNKPLVMSFHGAPGTGKNYVADRIAKHLYKYGVESQFIKKFMGRTDFPMESEVNYYRVVLDNNLFGQHIVRSQTISALRSFYKHLDKSNKPLVMSFHGTPGTGKNYVADRIAKHLYKYGVESQFIKKFMGRTDFPMESEVNYYRLLDLICNASLTSLTITTPETCIKHAEASVIKVSFDSVGTPHVSYVSTCQITLRSNITNAIKNCPRSLFIFDEVDKMPAGIFESLTSLLDHHDNVNGLNFRHSTFIFLSNAGGTEISQRLLDLMESGTLREDTKHSDFEKIAELAAYNVVGGLKKTSIIEASLIDHFIPFLPLEKRHIEKCIIAEFRNYGVFKPTHSVIEEISSNYVTYHNIFSTSGCKRLSKKVQLYADNYHS